MGLENRTTNPARRTAALVLAISLAVVLLLVGWSAVTPARAATNQISGVVTNPAGGLPPAETIVRLLKPNGDLFGIAQVEDGDGSFSFAPVPPGNYILIAKTADGTYTPSLPLPVLVAGAPVDAGILALTHPTLNGTVTTPDGVTPITGTVRIYRNGHLVQQETAVAGAISMGGLLSGTYAVQAFPLTDDPLWRSERLPLTVTTGISQEIDLTLRPANVIGIVTDPNQIPVSGATVHLLGETSYTYRRDQSSSSGYFAIGDLPDDSYALWVQPPPDAGGLARSTILSFTVSGGDLTDMGTIPLRDAPKTVTGIVETNTGTPVINARVVAKRLDEAGRQETHTGGDGSYELHLSGGLWALTIPESDAAHPADWLYNQPPLYIHFDKDLQPETKQLDFMVLTADATVGGTVTMPDGGVPPFTVTVQVRNNEGQGRAVRIDPADGSFSLDLPHGNYLLHIQPDDPGFAGPPAQPIYLSPQETLDAGALALVPRDAFIQGTVLNEDGHPIGGVHLVGWSRGYNGAQSTSGPDGNYLLPVTAGDWLVQPQVPYTLPYVYAGDPLSLTIAAGETVTGNEFVLTTADNMVRGQLVNGSGEPVTAEGWAAAADADGPVNGAPISAGSFELYLPDGAFQIKLTLAPGSSWLAGAAVPVDVRDGETISVTFPVQPQNAQLKGALWDPRQEMVPVGVEGMVLANNPFAWVGDAIDPANGSYALDLSAGLWHLGYQVDPASGYVVLDHHTVVPLEAEQTAVKPLPVTEKDALLTGIVFKPNGQPLPGAQVAVDGLSPRLEQVTLRTYTDEDGRFQLAVPHGRYRLRAGHDRPQEWLNPVLKTIAVPPAGRLDGLTLLFREADYTLSGTTALAGGDGADGTVHIWAYSSDGAATYTTTPLGQPYQLQLLSNSRWTIGAALETGSSYYAIRQTISTGTGSGTLDLRLNGPIPKPGPVVITFDAASAQHLSLADGTEIVVPAGAMPVEGEVTLHITPIATLPQQHHARLYKYGYAFIATDAAGRVITENFDQNVIIRFSYEEAALQGLGLSESNLKPAYYSTSTQNWTIPQSYVVDSTNNTVTLQIDHFTDYSLLSSPVFELMLPFVFR